MTLKEENTEEQWEEEEVFPAFTPQIFEADSQQDLPPEGFNAVTIPIDGRLQADLNWKDARQKALRAIENGYALFWDIQLGLFSRLNHPLSHQGQFHSLALSLEYFRDSLWKEFKTQTIGLSLYRGNIDFNLDFPWDAQQEENLIEWLSENEGSTFTSDHLPELRQCPVGQQWIRLFCRDVAIEYLALLASRLPDSLPYYLFLDTTTLDHSPISLLQLLNPERFERFKLALKGNALPFDALGWGKPTPLGYCGSSPMDLPQSHLASVGICLPPMNLNSDFHYQGMEDALRILQQQSIPFRLIAESQLTSCWDGLDYLFYSPNGFTPQGKRKLQGFCAAGGTVISTQKPVGFFHEITLSEWLIKL